MKALVTVSSRNRGTEGIAEAIAEAQRSPGVEEDEVTREAVVARRQDEGEKGGSAVSGTLVGSAQGRSRGQLPLGGAGPRPKIRHGSGR